MSGSNLYNPDQEALDTRWIQPWSEAFRAQRDVGLRVPINFHTVPATSLSRACFQNNQYEHNTFQKCFSNLLGVGFRRFAVDIYWDSLQSEWSLCPVEQPSSVLPEDGGVVPIRTGGSIQMSSGAASAKIPESTAPQLGLSLGFARRQETSQFTTTSGESSLVSGTSVAASSPTSNPVRPTVTVFPSGDGPPLFQIGKYNCTTSMTLKLLTGILEDFLKATSTTTGAALLMLTFNIHAASSILEPNSPAPQLSQPQLPISGSLLSDVLKGNLTDVTYTPTLLQQQRRNLNESWLNVDWNNRPMTGYYDISKDSSNHQTTTGWPTEAYIEFQKLYRLILSYGRIDPQMQLYNIGPDLDFIFPPQTLTDRRNTSVDSSGRVFSGCLFDQSDTTVTPQRNSSWAITVAPTIEIGANPNAMAPPIPAITNLTACGLTPYLNQTLANTTADKNPLPYAAYAHSTLWSWAPGEPLNVTAESNSTGNRCAVMMAGPYAGRWQVADCATRRRVACHEPSQPYNWELSSDVSDYENAASACRLPYRFSVPHTALENAHLLAALETHRENARAPILIDLNSLAVSDCWVIGQNGTCPYLPTSNTNRTRIVVVPTVAAMIIFVLAALTFFVKCAANRQENKRGRRRRMVDGWEYEGVPS